MGAPPQAWHRSGGRVATHRPLRKRSERRQSLLFQNHCIAHRGCKSSASSAAGEESASYDADDSDGSVDANDVQELQTDTAQVSEPTLAQSESSNTTQSKTSKGASTSTAVQHQRPRERSVSLGRRELREILSLALPALGSVISDPLMSLVDTACVGQMSSTELAALGPNSAIFNFIFQTLAFLTTGTTALLARNSLNAQGISSKERRNRQQQASVVLSNSLTLAFICGFVLVCFLLVCGPSLLGLLGADETVVEPAVQYLTIRAFASPAVTIMSASHGACLGQQDAWTTLRISIFSGLLNLVGDWYLILRLGMGVTGAAWATSISQYVGAVLFLRALQQRGRSSRGVPLEWHGFPTFTDLKPFLAVSGTLVTRTSLQMTSYSLITYTAMGLGTLATATHQVALQVFWFLSYFPEPLSITAQSLIARDMTESQRVRALARLLVRVGASMGVVLGLIGCFIYVSVPWLFTNDEAIMGSLKVLCPHIFLAEMLSAVTLVADGICIGSSDFVHLPWIGVVSTFVVGATLYVSKRVLPGLNGVWCAIPAFFLTRLVLHVWWARRNRKTSILASTVT